MSLSWFSYLPTLGVCWGVLGATFRHRSLLRPELQGLLAKAISAAGLLGVELVLLSTLAPPQTSTLHTCICIFIYSTFASSNILDLVNLHAFMTTCHRCHIRLICISKPLTARPDPTPIPSLPSTPKPCPVTSPPCSLHAVSNSGSGSSDSQTLGLLEGVCQLWHLCLFCALAWCNSPRGRWVMRLVCTLVYLAMTIIQITTFISNSGGGPEVPSSSSSNSTSAVNSTATANPTTSANSTSAGTATGTADSTSASSGGPPDGGGGSPPGMGVQTDVIVR